MGSVLQEHETIPGDLQVRQGQHPGGGTRQRCRGLLHRSVPPFPAGALPGAVCAPPLAPPSPQSCCPCLGCLHPLGATVFIFSHNIMSENKCPRRERCRAEGFTAVRPRLPGSGRAAGRGEPEPRQRGAAEAEELEGKLCLCSDGAGPGPKMCRESRESSPAGAVDVRAAAYLQPFQRTLGNTKKKPKPESPESLNVSVGKVCRIFFPVLFRGGFICVVPSQDSIPSSVGVVASPLCCNRAIAACSEVSASEGPIFGAEISVDKPRDLALCSPIPHSPDAEHPLQEQDRALC